MSPFHRCKSHLVDDLEADKAEDCGMSLNTFGEWVKTSFRYEDVASYWESEEILGKKGITVQTFTGMRYSIDTPYDTFTKLYDKYEESIKWIAPSTLDN